MSFESAKPWKVTKLIQISFFSAHLTSSDHLTVKAPRIYVALLAPHTLMPSAQKVGFIHSRWGGLQVDPGYFSGAFREDY